MTRSLESRDVDERQPRSGSGSPPRRAGPRAFQPRRGGPAERIGTRFEGRRPVVIAGIVWLAGFLVVALCLIAGLLIGHWASRGAPSKQVVELKGLPASASLPASTTAPSSSSTATKSSGAKAAGNSKAEEEAEEKTEAKESAAEKAPPPAAKKVNLNKLSKSSGKKHQEEIEANGAAPIETG